MRKLNSLLAAFALAAGASAVSAAPAQAATPTCTSWTTYYATGTTDFVVHVPSAGYQTGTVNCLLQQGNYGDAVTTLQRGLRYCRGYDISVDRDFGPQTRAAVLDTQRWANDAFGAGISEDGGYGPQTKNWIQFPVWTWPANTMTNKCQHSPV
ncbi:peptidoglycan-binding protein [Streptomyces sp. NPDC056244]|uniref:peptidoglycan-binding domain-containing protein n=1 Tax=unclassified Streptomyces TaxID=2593676 RepID=UPI0035DBA8FE